MQAFQRAHLNGRSILVTAGPTWVEIDAVRVITTTFTGRTGLGIARALSARGADVTLWLGPGSARSEVPADLGFTAFRTYDDLHRLVEESDLSRFDTIVHSAAVADYKPRKHLGKIPSGMPALTLELEPTVKLVDRLRARARHVTLVKFKLETGLSVEALLAKAEASRAHSDADLIVANRLEGIDATGHEAYLLGRQGLIASVRTKPELEAALAAALAKSR